VLIEHRSLSVRDQLQAFKALHQVGRYDKKPLPQRGR
jgi:hypothetical protein